MRFFQSFLAAVFLMAAFSFARAGSLGMDQGESYSQPTYREMTQTLMMLDGLDITNPIVANDYAMMFYCDLYRSSSKNDFEWQKIRTQIIQRVSAKKDYYRIQYELGDTVFLSVYNFETQDFPFTPQSALIRVGNMSLMGYADGKEAGVERLCGSDTYALSFPRRHILQLSQPLTIDRLKLPMDEAKQLLEKMESLRNKDRRLYVRFRFRLQSILKKAPPPGRLDFKRSKILYMGEVKQIDLFFDQAMTKFLTSVHIK